MCDKKWEKMLQDGDFKGNPVLSYIYHSIVQNSNVEFVKFKPYEYLIIKVNNIIYEISLIKKKISSLLTTCAFHIQLQFRIRKKIWKKDIQVNSYGFQISITLSSVDIGCINLPMPT